MSSNTPTPKPLRIAVTGGIGSGKSYICRRIADAGHPVFYCDDVAKHLIRTLPELRRDLTALVGATVYDASGALVKPVLAAYICGSREQAARVDALVHPRVAEAFRRWVDEQNAAIVFMECALLYESGFDRLVDCVAVVAVPEALRLRRVMERDGVTEVKAREWMCLQMPEEEKARRADIIIHNDDRHDMNVEIARLYRLTKKEGRKNEADGEQASLKNRIE